MRRRLVALFVLQNPESLHTKSVNIFFLLSILQVSRRKQVRSHDSNHPMGLVVEKGRAWYVQHPPKRMRLTPYCFALCPSLICCGRCVPIAMRFVSGQLCYFSYLWLVSTFSSASAGTDDLLSKEHFGRKINPLLRNLLETWAKDN